MTPLAAELEPVVASRGEKELENKSNALCKRLDERAEPAFFQIGVSVRDAGL